MGFRIECVLTPWRGVKGQDGESDGVVWVPPCASLLHLEHTDKMRLERADKISKWLRSIQKYLDAPVQLLVK